MGRKKSMAEELQVHAVNADQTHKKLTQRDTDISHLCILVQAHTCSYMQTNMHSHKCMHMVVHMNTYTYRQSCLQHACTRFIAQAKTQVHKVTGGKNMCVGMCVCVCVCVCV